MISFLKARMAREIHKLIILFFALLAFVFPAFLYSQPHPVPQGAKCAECGMLVDQKSRFMSEITTKDAKSLYFCDIGDMLFHLRKLGAGTRDVYVRDYSTGTWIDGRKARYVLSKKISTPMSWGIAAFQEESEAKQWGSPVDFDHASTLLK